MVTRGYSWLQEVTGDYKSLKTAYERLQGLQGVTRGYRGLQGFSRG